MFTKNVLKRGAVRPGLNLLEEVRLVMDAPEGLRRTALK